MSANKQNKQTEEENKPARAFINVNCHCFATLAMTTKNAGD